MVYRYNSGFVQPFFIRHFRFMALAIAGLFVFSQLAMFIQPARATTTNIVVTPSFMASDLTEVFLNTDSWFFYNDESDTIDNTLGSFVTGPASPPEGDDSVEISVSGSERRNLATYQFGDIDLSSISDLRFSTYNPSAGNGGSSDRSGYLHFNVDFNGTDAWQSRLVFVPSDNGSISQDVWQEWDAISDGTAQWRYSGSTWPGTSDPGLSTLKTWDEILAEYPAVRTRTSDPWLGIRVGEPYADGYTENIDKFVMGVEDETKVFDFEQDNFVVDGKIRICHATSSEANPFNNISVNINSIEKAHGVHQDGEDIIPPYDEEPDGRNWTFENRLFWLENCGDGEVQGETCEPGPTWANSVIDFNQGDKKNGGAVGDDRSNADDVLGTPDVAEPTVDGFFSLGFDGDITVSFDGFVTNEEGDDLSFHETTFGNRDNYGEETATVEVSQDGSEWHLLSETLSGRDTEGGDGVTLVDFEETGLDYIKYVKVADTSDPNNFTDGNADGYDIDAIDATNQVCQQPEQPIEECSISLFSNTFTQVEEYEGAGAEELTFVHSGWTADIPGATWIWSDDPVVDTDNDTIRTFVQDFYWSGPVTTAVLDVAADNSYEVYVNGVLIGGDASEKNFTLATQDQYDISGEINDGVNTLEVVVTNKGVPGSNPAGNPAGVLFAATVTGTDQYCDAPLSECVVDFSDTTLTVNEYADANAHEVSFIHSAWTATIDGATWVWGDDPVADPVNDTTQTFKREFSWNGPVASAVLDLAADNSYRVLLNGVEVVADSSENNFASTDTIDLSAHIQDGVNTLEVEVKNWAQAGGTTESNPAGLLYRLIVEGENGCIPDEEQAEPIGRISGVAYNDENDNGTQDDGEPGLNGWEIWLLTQNSPFTLIETFTTDDSGSGEYLFEDLAYGTYFVCQFPETGWTQTEVPIGVGVTVEIDDLIFSESCYEVELTAENPLSAENDFGNSSNVEGAVTTKDPDNGSVLGDNTDGQVLAETGEAAWQLPAVGALMAITSIAAGLASRKRFSTQRF